MNKTINQLSDLTQIENDDELVVWDITAGTSKKAKARQFKNIFISATSTTVTGAGIVSGDVVKIMFTSAITGSDTTTGMTISYNGTSYAVKVGKQGSLVDLVAHDISGTYTYLQAYTTLELAFDGTQFVIMGNPIVLSSNDYTIYADGSKVYSKEQIDKKNRILYADYDITPSSDGHGSVTTGIAYNLVTGVTCIYDENFYYSRPVIAIATSNDRAVVHIRASDNSTRVIKVRLYYYTIMY